MATQDEPAVCTCTELSSEDIPGSMISRADLEKCKKSELKFWLNCRGLRYKSTETRAELLSRVRQNLDKDFILIDPDPGKAYTRAKKARCRFCSGEEQLRNPESQEPEALVTDTDVDVEESWSTDTSVLPKRFSYLNIVEHAKKSGREAKSYVEKPLEKGYKFFYENYCHDVLCKLEENEIHVKGKCFRSQKKNERPHNVTVILLTTGDVKRAKCSCPAGANGYCNHTMGLLYLIDYVIKLKAPEFPRIGTCTDNPQQWHKPRTQGINPEPSAYYGI